MEVSWAQWCTCMSVRTVEENCSTYIQYIIYISIYIILYQLNHIMNHQFDFCHFVLQFQSVVWFFKKHLDSSEETRVLTDHHGNKLLDTSQIPHSGDLRSRFSIRLFSLLIFRAGPGDSGIYICGSAHKDFFYGYDLDIQQAYTLNLAPRWTERLKVNVTL